MIAPFLFLLAMSSSAASENHISTAIENYKTVESYQVTLRSKSSDSSEIIKYYYKKPGFVRMEFVKPHNGAVLIYNPFKKEVKLTPFAFLRLFTLTLSPDSILIRSKKGHRVDASDIGELLKTVKMLQDGGKTEILGHEDINGKSTIIIKVKGEGNFTINEIHGYILQFDKNTHMPIKVSSYNTEWNLIEEVLMDDLEINIELPEGLFNP